MKQTILLFVFTVAIFAGCKKDKNNESETPISNELKLHPIKKKYISNDGKSYYSGTFVRSYEIKTYTLKVENGKKYILFTYTPSWSSDVRLAILNENKDTIAKNNETRENLVFTSPYTGTCYIKVIFKSQTNSDFGFRLYVREEHDYNISWKGKDWLAFGDWTVNSDGGLTHKTDGRGIQSWLRLNDSTFSGNTISFQMHSTFGKGFNKKGFLVNGRPMSEPFPFYLPYTGSNISFDRRGEYINRDYTGFGGAAGPIGSFSGSFENNVTATYTAVRNSGNWNFLINGFEPPSSSKIIKGGYVFLLVDDNEEEEIIFTSFTID